MAMNKTTILSNQEKGFTLLETLIGMFVFGLIALGLTQLILHSQFQAQASLRQQAADIIAVGVLESLISKNNNSLVSGTQSVTLHDGTVLSLPQDTWVSSTFDLLGTPLNTQDDMPIDLRLNVTNNLDSDSDPHVLLQLDYRWPRKLIGDMSESDKTKWQLSEIVMIRSNIRSYSE